jgi:hypothetical protein
MAVRTIIQKWHPTAGWTTCKDSGWQHSGTDTWLMGLRINMYTQPDCGNGLYRSRSAGLYWSYSLSKWLGGWVNSATNGVPLPPGCRAPVASTWASTDPAFPPGPDFASAPLPADVQLESSS